MTLPGEDLTDEEFLNAFILTYSKGGSFGFVRADAFNNTDYIYAHFTGPKAHWAVWNREHQEWLVMENTRIIGLLKMVAFPEVVE